jgi:nicotinamide mononucleotide transporter
MTKSFKFNLNYVVFGVFSLVLIVLSYTKTVPMSMTEVLGFITGALCVWLCVIENIWNWPIGIANSVFFLIMFWQANLFADSLLQIVYITTGFYGWWEWLYGGENRSNRKIDNSSLIELALVIVAVGGITWLMYLRLTAIKDASPFLDAFTTALSLGGQYLLCRKFIQNWHFWIVADILYIYLYFNQSLYLTGILYIGFFIMACMGLFEWKRRKKNG